MRPAHLLAWFFARLLPLVVLALVGARAMAQSDPPSRAGRVNLAEGTVVFSQAGDNEWTDVIRNRPLTRGDRVGTERNSRAEIQVGSSAVRIAANTRMEILQLDDRAAQLSVTQGSVYVRIRTLPEGENFEIDTPNLAYRAAYPGDYRIDVDPVRGVTRVTIHSGTGSVYGEAGQVLPLGGGQQITFGARTLAQVSVQESPPQDNFDRWAADRNRREEQSVSARYVPREVVGYQELDSAGQWSQDATHGAVWFPQGLPANWAPYRNGHWEWMSPWGWTWFDDAAWGFAPFHYGRWAMLGSRWAWVPGRLSLKPVYAPALVAFVGGGGADWKLPLASGKPGVAWFPLAPGEVWRPGYRASPVYMSNLNQNLKLDDNPTYANQRKPEALTSVSAEDFHRGKPVGAGWLRIAANSLTNAQIVPPPPMPERGAVVAMSRAAPAKVVPPQPAAAPPAPAPRAAAPVTPVAAAPASQPKPATELNPAVLAAAQAQAAAQAARVQAVAQQQAEVQRVLQAAQQQRAAAEQARQQLAKGAPLPAVAAAKAPAAPAPAPAVVAAVPPVVPAAPAAVQAQVVEQSRRAEFAKAEAAKAEAAKAELAKAELAKARLAKMALARVELAKAERAKADRVRAEQARAEQARIEQARAEALARSEKQARRAEQAKREQLARRAEAKLEQIAAAKEAKLAQLTQALAKRELVAKRDSEQAGKRELLARQAEQAKREQVAKRLELQREEAAQRAEQKREQLAKQAEQDRREAVARRDEQQRRELHAQNIEQARRSADRDAQVLREQRAQREEQQARREAQERQERELAQQQAQRAAIARQQQSLAEQWRRDQQVWEQQQQQIRIRGGRPDLRDDRRSQGIPILSSGPLS